jgi:hypothetical protein
MHLSAPPAFEGPDFRLEIKFQDAAELMALLVELQSLVKEPDFQNLTAF